jgi:hypothetical protein
MVLNVCVIACVSACAALDYRYSFDADLTSKYDDEIFEKNSNEDTMEFMDQLKVRYVTIILITTYKLLLLLFF